MINGDGFKVVYKLLFIDFTLLFILSVFGAWKIIEKNTGQNSGAVLGQFIKKN